MSLGGTVFLLRDPGNDTILDLSSCENNTSNTHKYPIPMMCRFFMKQLQYDAPNEPCTHCVALIPRFARNLFYFLGGEERWGVRVEGEKEGDRKEERGAMCVSMSE